MYTIRLRLTCFRHYFVALKIRKAKISGCSVGGFLSFFQETGLYHIIPEWINAEAVMEFSSWMPLFIFFLLSLVSCEHIIQTFDGEIGAGNFTYFTLKKEGEVTLILNSVEGDADIYVSQENLKPDFEHYDLKSVTCGEDVVTIPSYYKRPIGISVFGHVYAPLSKYTMKVLMDYSVTEESEGHHGNHEDSEESLIWTVFVNILKIILEILL